MGGGDGVGGISSITQSIVSKLSCNVKDSQVVVVCGHNTKVQEKLKSKKWPSNVNVVVRGFCSNIDEYMSAVDCLITKAGPGTIAEAMTRGLPIILSSFLPGQEAGNVPYVVDGGFGVYTGMKPQKIADAVSHFFKDEALLQSMSRRALASAKPDATISIARDIANIAVGARVAS
jgi:1,2-diacylglycerol 3-beta-galactosyltransferase